MHSGEEERGLAPRVGGERQNLRLSKIFSQIFTNFTVCRVFSPEICICQEDKEAATPRPLPALPCAARLSHSSARGSGIHFSWALIFSERSYILLECTMPPLARCHILRVGGDVRLRRALFGERLCLVVVFLSFCLPFLGGGGWGGLRARGTQQVDIQRNIKARRDQTCIPVKCDSLF